MPINPEKLAALNRRFTAVMDDLVSASPSRNSTLNTLNDIFNPWRKDFSDQFTDLDVFYKLVITLEALVAFRKTRNALSVMEAEHLQQEMLDMVSTVAVLLPQHLLEEKTDDFSELRELLNSVKSYPVVSRYHTLEFLITHYSKLINLLLLGREFSLEELLVSYQLDHEDFVTNLLSEIEHFQTRITFVSILSSGALVGGLLGYVKELKNDKPQILIASPHVELPEVVFQNPVSQLNTVVLVDDVSATFRTVTKVRQAFKNRFGDEALVMNP